MSAGGNSAVGECTDQFGNTGFNPHSGFYIRKAGSTTISSCIGSNNCIAGSFYFDPAQPVNNLTMISCRGTKAVDNIVTASISGTVLTITGVSSGSGIAIGMPVTGPGISADTVITGGKATEPGTLTGYNNVGTYRVNNSQTVGSRSMTLPYGPDWALPTTTEAGAGLLFINCGSSLPGGEKTSLTLATVFTALPGEAGSSSNMHRYEGQEYNIRDCNTAIWGAIASGGGTNHVKVRFNGTNWTVLGK
jgi:hypothetical protein